MEDQSKTQSQSKELSAELGQRHWFWVLLWKGGAVRSLIPWPLPGIVAELRWRLRKWKSVGAMNAADKTRFPRDHGVWSALAYGGSAIILYKFGTENLARAPDLGRNLFTGAFLIGTLLSVSSGTVASAVIRSTAVARPKSIRSLGAVFGWSLLWGLAGAGSLVLYNDTPSYLRPAALVVGAMGIVAELNAITFVFRVFLLGLVDAVKQDEKRTRDAEKLAKGEKQTS